MEDKEAQALNIVTQHMWWASGAGLIPLPFVDQAAIGAVQLKMLKSLAEHYEIPFSDNYGKSAIGAFLGGFLQTSAVGTTRGLLKMIPVVGSVLGLVTTPMVASASTYALGKIFIQHFESGGTFLDFDPSKVKAHFSQQFEKGKTIVAEKKTEKKADKKPDKKEEGEPVPAAT